MSEPIKPEFIRSGQMPFGELVLSPKSQHDLAREVVNLRQEIEDLRREFGHSRDIDNALEGL